MSTAGLRTTAIDPDEDPPQGSLGLGTWLLVPLVLIGGYGFVSPALALARGETAESRRRAEEAERVPTRRLVRYGGELTPLLDDERLSAAERETFRSRHERYLRATERDGGITRAQMRGVRRALRRAGR